MTEEVVSIYNQKKTKRSRIERISVLIILVLSFYLSHNIARKMWYTDEPQIDVNNRSYNDQSMILGAATDDQGFRLLPENTRYFEYRGLPFIAITDLGDTRSNATPDWTYLSELDEIDSYISQFYMTTWTLNSQDSSSNCPRYNNTTRPDRNYANLRCLYDEVTRDNNPNWDKLEEIAQWTQERGIMLNLFLWGCAWNYSQQEYLGCGGTDMTGDPYDSNGIMNMDLARENLSVNQIPGVTRLDIHKEAIKKVVETTWKYPNVVYTYEWEYNFLAHDERYPERSAKDEGGVFHNWWVDEMKRAGREYNQRHGTNVNHLFSIEYAGNRPSDYHADFIVNECQTAFQWSGMWNKAEGHRRALGYRVPLVYWSTDSGYFSECGGGGSASVGTCDACQSRADSSSFTHCGEGVPWGGACSENGRYPTPCQIREMLTWSWHPSTSFVKAAPASQRYFQQARWYIENILTWGDEHPDPYNLDARRMGDEINLDRLPQYQNSNRPVLSNVSGYTDGARRNGDTIDFAVTYRDPDGNSPATHFNGRPQTEVWVDVNGDGRFDPDLGANERFLMTGSGTNYRNGVTYTYTGIRVANPEGDIRYVFRFADQYWYPPEYNSLFPTNYTNLIVEGTGAPPPAPLPIECSGECLPAACNTYNSCSPGSGVCSSGYCCSGTCSSTPTPTHAPQGLIGHWKFDEGYGVTARDSSNSNNNGVLENNPQWISGKIDDALKFDGLDDYVSIGKRPDYNITDSITLMGWIRPEGISRRPHPTIIGKPNAYRLSIGRTSFTPDIALHIPDANEANIWGYVTCRANWNDRLKTGEWNHVAGTYSTSDRTLRLYINGELKCTQTVTGTNGNITQRYTALEIGRWTPNASRINASLDDIKIFNTALSRAEVAAEANPDTSGGASGGGTSGGTGGGTGGGSGAMGPNFLEADNPDFTNRTDGWRENTYGTSTGYRGTFRWNGDAGPNGPGDAAVYIENTQEAYSRYMGSDTFLSGKISPDTRYKFSYWVRNENMPSGSNSEATVYFTSGGKWIVPSPTCGEHTGIFGWRRIECTIISPSNADGARIDLRLNGIGAVWFDKVSIYWE